MTEMTYRDVVRLLELIDTSDGVELDLAMGDLRLKVTRSKDAGAGAARTQPAAEAAPEITGTAPDPAAPPTATPDVAGNHPDATVVGAPMGGIFYAAAAPGQPPFVTEGQQVKEGDQLGIVEVMKLFTAITAPRDGVVVAILVGNQDTVAKDDPLMFIEPAQ